MNINLKGGTKMKKIVILIGIMLLTVTAMAQYSYLGSIYSGGQDPGDPTETVGAVALKANGDLYYVTFNEAESHFVYVARAIPGCIDTTYTTHTLATDSFPTLRGFNDIELDSAGNIYISGTGNSTSDTVLKKFSAVPAHALQWSIQALDTAQQIRHNGIDILDDNTLAINQTWNAIAYKNTSDGLNTSSAVSGGSSYHRSLSLNTTNNDFYVGKNGGSVTTALKVFSGGSPSNPTGYSLALDNQMPNLGVSTLYGVATQATDYDPNNNQLIIADQKDSALSPADTVVGARIYNIAGSGASTIFTEAQFIDRRSPSAPSPEYMNCYGVAYAKVTKPGCGGDYLALAVQTYDMNWFIDIYVIPNAGVESWSLY